MESLKVKFIRENELKITKEPIVYYWWFKTNIFGNLLSKLKTEIEIERIELTVIISFRCWTYSNRSKFKNCISMWTNIVQ